MPQVEASQQQMVEQLTAGQPLTDQQRQDMQRILATSARRVREALAWDKLQPLYRDIYRQTFTGDDMDAMIGFYSGSAGQKLLDKMPQLMQNTMTAMQKVIVPMIEQMQRDVAAEMQAPPAPPAPPAVQRGEIGHSGHGRVGEQRQRPRELGIQRRDDFDALAADADARTPAAAHAAACDGCRACGTGGCGGRRRGWCRRSGGARCA